MIVKEAHASDRQPAPDKRRSKTVGYDASLREEQNCEEKHHNNTYPSPARCWYGVRTTAVGDVQDFSAEEVIPCQAGEEHRSQNGGEA
jgi:hypothetical protein